MSKEARRLKRPSMRGQKVSFGPSSEVCSNLACNTSLFIVDFFQLLMVIY